MSEQSEFFTIPKTLDRTSGYLGVQANELHPDDLSVDISSIDAARQLLKNVELTRSSKEISPQDKIADRGSRIVSFRNEELPSINLLDPGL